MPSGRSPDAAAFAAPALDAAYPAVPWAPDGPGLAALLDVGLTPSALARYFRVSEDDVAGWIAGHGIASRR
ncbi:MAG: hypothetical protein IT561_26105 [Alphaproteobacteria bacterium]|nr:hypothetical protein [Alphaproteobacteria bacterium]